MSVGFTRIDERKKTANVAMIETAVEDVSVPIRNANAMSAAIPNRMIPAAKKKRGWTRPVFQMTRSHIAPRR